VLLVLWALMDWVFPAVEHALSVDRSSVS
jgi:hypothetical protein